MSCYSNPVEVEQCCAFGAMPRSVKSATALSRLLATISECHICSGNPTAEFEELVEAHGGIFKDASGCRTIAYRDTHSIPPTIRHGACEFLLSPDSKASRCKQCASFRVSLRVCKNCAAKKTEERTDPRSSTPYCSLSREEMRERMKKLHNSLHRIQRQRERLQLRVKEVVEARGVVVDEELHDDLKEIMKTEGSKLMERAVPGSFQQVFWQQQMDAASGGDSRGMRWHPPMIRWCIYLRHQSQSAYETLRQCISLPSQRTLRDYTYHVRPTSGFSNDVDQELHRAANLDQCKEREKYVMLLLDEMHMKEELVYDKHTGQLIGFVNLGEINSHLQELKRSLAADSSPSPTHPPLASTMMTFMVRGLFSHLQYPYAQFPCSNMTGDLLFEPFWEAAFHLGFKVLGATCDGASLNRRFLRLHHNGKKLGHKTVNPYADDGWELYFFSDPPHLIKTIRNCWASKCRALWNNGKEISWRHLRDLYHRNRSESGLALIPKLRYTMYEHINLISFSKMQVDLAAQALSCSVSKALTLLGGSEASETAEFCDVFDKFFDALNVSNFTDGKHHRKPFQNPYCSGTDFRLKWLRESFIGYLDKWEASVAARAGFANVDKKRMLLSQETLEGLRMTTHSFIELVEYVFKIPDVKVFFSRRICQDPLEKFFGCQRQRGATNDNPSVHQFMQNTQVLRVVNSFCRDVTKGNCRGNKDREASDKENIPLPRHPNASRRHKTPGR